VVTSPHRNLYLLIPALLMIVACVLWGLLGVANERTKEDLFLESSITTAFLRLFFASITSFLFCILFIIIDIKRWHMGLWKITKRYLKIKLGFLIILGFLGFTLSIPLYFIGFDVVGIAINSIIGLGIYPALVFLLKNYKKIGNLSSLRENTLSLVSLFLLFLAYFLGFYIYLGNFTLDTLIRGVLATPTLFAISWAMYVYLLGKLEVDRFLKEESMRNMRSYIYMSMAILTITMFAGSVFLLLIMYFIKSLNIAIYPPLTSYANFLTQELEDFIKRPSYLFKLSFFVLFFVCTFVAYLIYYFSTFLANEYYKPYKVEGSDVFSIVQFVEAITGIVTAINITRAKEMQKIKVPEAEIFIYIWTAIILFLSALVLYLISLFVEKSLTKGLRKGLKKRA